MQQNLTGRDVREGGRSDRPSGRSMERAQGLEKMELGRSGAGVGG